METIPYDKRSGKIWLNKDLIDWKDAKIHVLNHGLHYASCVFEGERVYDGEIFKLEEHTDRLFYSAKRMGIDVPYSQKEINLASKNIINVQKIKNGYVRPVIWRGSEMMAISAQKNKINVAIAAWEWGSYFDPKLKLNGIKLNISSWRRPSPNSVPWDTKAAGLYMICTLSKHEAKRLRMNIEYKVDNCEHLELKDDSYDLVYGTGIIHHLNTEKCINEISRILKDNGTIVFLEPLGTNPIINFYRKITPKARSHDEHPLIKKDFDIIKQKFKIFELKYYGFLTLILFLIYRDPSKSKVFKLLSVIDQVLFKLKVFQLLAWSVVITAKKS